jgi:S-adenosylmethionine decarboxylase proenzyme
VIGYALLGENLMKALGKHILCEFYGCDQACIADADRVREILLEAAEVAGATIVDSMFHQYSPHGVSGVVVIEESHLAIHTWPEHGFAAVDLFTCGESVDPWAGFHVIEEAFQAENSSSIELKRGFIK